MWLLLIGCLSLDSWRTSPGRISMLYFLRTFQFFVGPFGQMFLGWGNLFYDMKKRVHFLFGKGLLLLSKFNQTDVSSLFLFADDRHLLVIIFGIQHQIDEC